MAIRLTLRLAELAKTVRSLVSAVGDLIDLHLSFYMKKKPGTFAFLVHPRSSEFLAEDVYGSNDIFRPFPALRWLTFWFEPERAAAMILWFSKRINPIRLSKITVTTPNRKVLRGYLLSTVRTPEQLFTGGKNTRDHLSDLFSLAGAKRVERVGLGALLPSLSRYGKDMTTTVIEDRPAISTGHAYTGHVIVQYLKLLVDARNAKSSVVRVAIVGAAGSTGKSALRTLMVAWNSHVHIELVLVDLPQKVTQLQKLVNEARQTGKFVNVHNETSLNQLRTCEYVICVTSAVGTIILPEHMKPGSVIIDDSQPRNTSPVLKEHGIHVLDVLARINGLDVGFDFGFRVADKGITFTCLAETVIAAAVGDGTDLAVGEVTVETVRRTMEIVHNADKEGLIGSLPLVSFGEQMDLKDVELVFNPEPEKNAPAAP